MVYYALGAAVVSSHPDVEEVRQLTLMLFQHSITDSMLVAIRATSPAARAPRGGTTGLPTGGRRAPPTSRIHRAERQGVLRRFRDSGSLRR